MERIIKALRLEELEKFEPIRKLADKLGVKVTTLGLGVIAVVVVFTLLSYGGDLLCSLIGFLYPAYLSYKALEHMLKDIPHIETTTVSKLQPHFEEFRQWLTYWVVYAVFCTLDPFLSVALFFVGPLYTLVKIALFIYLYHPSTRGAQKIYDTYLRKVLRKYESEIDKRLSDVTNKIDTAATEVKKTVKDHGNKYGEKYVKDILKQN